MMLGTFSWFIGHFFVKCLFRYFAYFLKLASLPVSELRKFVLCLGPWSFVRCMYCEYLLPECGFTFHRLVVSFDEQFYILISQI